ncbi:GIY-YIG nuclease family protein [Adhaeribacter soli]|uniref:GIY-YIG nuclease family protein n=1 Tax=Adhaeribacter soli TaxID=2607655 RepID=A0A5N1IVD9_9BACT|nr:GIY-YIG nuclease family protein [Adhaeribacter soli]KAA9331899.1 GIY-YIG nuclease family protein [Adhaeribacter soli]
MKEHQYFIYITCNPGRTVLYVGVTNNLEVRLEEHRRNKGKPETFAGRYYCYKLLYYERFKYINYTISREKVLKLMSRQDKEALIRTETIQRWNFSISMVSLNSGCGEQVVNK